MEKEKVEDTGEKGEAKWRKVPEEIKNNTRWRAVEES